MTIKELLLKEIDSSSNEVLEDLYRILQALKTHPQLSTHHYRELLERIDYLETIVNAQKGLDEFEQGQGILAEDAFATLQAKLDIPPRS